MVSDATKKFLIAAVLLLLIDIPWLTATAGAQQSVISTIQCGKKPYFRLSAAIPVYLALAYLVTHATDTTNAFLMGLSVYAVYDFTVYVAFQDYPLWLAVADALWGGVLFVLVFQAMKFLKA